MNTQIQFNGFTEFETLEYYLSLPQPDNLVQVMYVWIDGTGEILRGKTRTLDFEPKLPEDCPIWNFDGSSTGQAQGHNSDVFLYPVRLFPDPFRRGKNKLLLCETYNHERKPTKQNLRVLCKEVMGRPGVAEEKPLFGFEQEYTLLDQDLHPFGWPKNGYPGPQGTTYHSGVGANKVYGRAIVEAHYRACLYAGINMWGSNAETMPSQWEFQIGPNEGLEVADQLWMARYILYRVAEPFGVAISLDPKPIPGDWNGAGNHCNYSTEKMRNKGGVAEMEKAIALLEKEHSRHMSVYDPHEGKDNIRRLTGLHETQHYSKFTWGIADRNASVRIPRVIYDDACGYLEDRRPSSNCDPYIVTTAMVRTCILKEWEK